MNQKKLNPILIFLLWTTAQLSVAQNDSIKKDSLKYDRFFVLNEGVYMHYVDFRNNRPISKDVIRSKDNKDQLEFLANHIANSDFIYFTFGDIEHKVHVDSLWGFCQNNAVYIRYDNDFFRIPVFGHICLFIASVEVYRTGGMMTDPYMMYGMTATNMPVKTKEMKQLMFNFYSGEILPYTLNNVKKVLEGDKKLSEEFLKLKKRKQKKLMGMYLRRYNEANPIYFPKEN